MSVSTHKPTFAELGVAAEIVDALSEQGITHTFAIQELTLPIALDGRDIIGQARTGMGKTLGFGVPLLDRVFDAADVAELDGTPAHSSSCLPGNWHSRWVKIWSAQPGEHQ